MKVFLKLLQELIEKELNNGNRFSLIKLESFSSPKIYYEVCNNLSKMYPDFAAKLSMEKYKLWLDNEEFKNELEALKSNNFIELNENLTKWRNKPFLDNKERQIILMGTEEVEDKGGLEEFYTISPETIESYIGDNYSILLDKLDFSANEDQKEIFNIFYKSLFSVVQKNILKLSNFLDEYINCDFLTLLKNIYLTLYEYWEIPNINLSRKMSEKQTKDLLINAYKFSRRVGIEKYQKDKIINELNDKIQKYYSKKSKNIDNEWADIFPEYNDIVEFENDLKDYIKGFNLNEVKERLFKCDFGTIDEILKYKTSTVKTQSQKVPKITGDPFKVLSYPILIGVNDNKNKAIKKIIIKIESIKLANTKVDSDKLNNGESSSEELISKWLHMCYFLGGIEKLIEDLPLVNNYQEEIDIKIVSEISKGSEICDLYPFKYQSIKDLHDNGILTSGPYTESKSKIELKYEFQDENKNNIDILQYQWNIYDHEPWVNAFSILELNEFINVAEANSILPIAWGNDVNILIDSISLEEFYNSLNTIALNYININIDLLNSNSNGTFYQLLMRLGSTFSIFLKELKDSGFYSTFKSSNSLIIFLNCYADVLLTTRELIMKKQLKEGEEQLVLKAFMLLNDENIKRGNLIGAIIPSYHPIMLEKMVERYKYLSNGFDEIYKQIVESNETIHESYIKGIFDRFDQLSTITSPLDVLVGKDDKFIEYKATYGFYSIFGQVNQDYSDVELLIDDINGEDTDDTKLPFVTNPVSSYIAQVIAEYIKTYPAKVDGTTIAFYEPKDYKDIISGLQVAIKQILKNNRVKIKVIVYTSDYKVKESNYIKYWIENSFSEDDDIEIEAAIKHVDYSSEGEESFRKKLILSDIVFINEIMSTNKLQPEETENLYSEVQNIIQSRYPAVYLPQITNNTMVRKMIISQQQFQCSNLFTQLVINSINKIARDSQYKIIKTVSLEPKKERIYNNFHDYSSWVVVLDQNIDTEILNQQDKKIIAFTTGKGYFGELNTAISSKKDYVVDLKNFLRSRLKAKFTSWSAEDINKAAEACVENAINLDGAELIKAINPLDEAINNYLAYILISSIENVNKKDENCFIRKIISLDSYNHLFDEKYDLEDASFTSQRPDFLILEVLKSENDLNSNDEIKINLTLIECKVAKENDMHVENAKEQLIAGAKRIQKIWDCNSDTVQNRFWFNQLYRILSFNNKDIKANELNKINEKIYKINEGRFNITISNKLYTFWLDLESENDYNSEIINIDDVEIKHVIASSQYIKKVLLDLKYVNEPNNITKNDDSNNKSSYEKDKEKIISAYDDKDNIIDNDEKEEKLSGNSNNNFDKQIVNAIEQFSSKSIIDVFNSYANENIEDEEEKIKSRLNTLKNELDFRNVKVYIKEHIIGPDIIRTSIELGSGINVSDVEKYKNDMRLWLHVNEKPLIFIENGYLKLDMTREKRQIVSMKGILEKISSNPNLIKDYKNKMICLLGEDVIGNPLTVDFSDSNTPHLLIAGQTGSGKSVLLAAILTSIMCLYTPEEVEYILVDPKMVELTAFSDSPFTKKIATSIEETLEILEELVNEMKSRYRLFQENRVQNIVDYNKLVSNDKKLRRIITVIDEYGQLIQDDKDSVKKFEAGIKSLSQLARAAGIHLIICTQTPRADIITTPIRNNLTARIALRVADSNASSLIIDSGAAESLLGKGDMFLKTAETSSLIRGKSMFVTQEEIYNLIDLLKNR